MRNTEERVAAVKLRVKEMKRQKQVRQDRFISMSSVAACLLFIIGFSFAMPGMLLGLPGGAHTYSGTAASIFDGSRGFGYVFIGVLAFSLGVSVTILCYRIRLRNQMTREDTEDNDG
jgi:multisubunit Na+/H+ antiporter MnhB subunit